MRPLKRQPVNRFKSAKVFKRHAQKTKRVNFAAPMRGGIRL